jgi:hypothetical protein
MGVPTSSIIKNKTTKPQQNAAHRKPHARSISYEAGSTERLDHAPAPTRTRHPRRERLDRALYGGAPRPNSDSHEARSPNGKTPTHVTPGQALDPLTSPTPGQKSEHLMRLPASTYRYGRNQDRRGSNAGVNPHCFTAHHVMGGESCHCTHLTVHCLPSITLEGGYDKTHTPQSRGFGLIRLTSTRPRPNLDAQHSSKGKEGRYGPAL